MPWGSYCTTMKLVQETLFPPAPTPPGSIARQLGHSPCVIEPFGALLAFGNVTRPLPGLSSEPVPALTADSNFSVGSDPGPTPFAIYVGPLRVESAALRKLRSVVSLGATHSGESASVRRSGHRVTSSPSAYPVRVLASHQP